MNENLIENQVQIASTQISVGLSPEASLLVQQELVRLIHTALKPEYESMAPDLEDTVQWSSQRIIGEVTKIPPQKRLEYIQLEIFGYEIGRLDRDCDEIAIKSISVSPDMPALQAQARENLEKIEGYYRLLEEKVPFWERRFGRNLSEATLDCKFVLGMIEHSSLRLGRVIKNLEKGRGWPPDWYRELWMKEK